ncbi:hypothetical protein GCM10010271_13080 [Streptomyces kurssanovii]|nr:hypothetical protein GCM10010271_13080 [Streptomyces kurssanovii]
MSSKESTESAEPEGKSDMTPDTETAEAETAVAEKTHTEADEEGTPDPETVNESPKAGAGGGRAGVAIAAVLLLACGGLIGYGVLDSEEKPKPPTVPTAAVTYEVTGEGPVEISYLARSEDGTATVVRGAELPWKKTVQVPLGKPPTIAIVLGEKGGQAACTLAIRGEHVQRATAMGEFGRATCAGELPATDN